MQNAEAAIEPAFYDHMDDTVRPTRTAADWGADEVFASVPRRRFRGDQHGAASGQRRGPAQHAPIAPARVDDDGESVARAAWLSEVEAELAQAELPTDVGLAGPAPLEARPQDLVDGVSFDEPAAREGAPVQHADRRTVTIAGRPGAAVTPRRPVMSDRRRPPRTVAERVGARPDRFASWSCGMGLLLIVVAALS
jgi:hypothetical protein